MYNQQQQNFHTAAYRGDQMGHDAYLRSDSQQPTVQSQYRGYQKPYQPTGNVQSFYQGNSSIGGSFAGQGAGFQAQAPIQTGYQQQQQQQQYASPESFHAANYRGNQAGHDNYLRSDSQQPSNFAQHQQPQFQAQQQFGNSMNTNVNSFHAANYRGDQPGHDNYLRADSMNPTNQAQYQPVQSAYQQPIQNQFGYRG